MKIYHSFLIISTLSRATKTKGVCVSCVSPSMTTHHGIFSSSGARTHMMQNVEYGKAQKEKTGGRTTPKQLG